MTFAQNVVFVSNSRIPSRSANLVHTLNMCDAFGQAGCDVTLLARTTTGWDDRYFDDYGLQTRFKVSLCPLRPGFRDKIAFARHVRRKLKGFDPETTLVTGGSGYALLLGVPRPFRIAYDVHTVQPNRTIRFVERLLIAGSNFLSMTPTTQTLIDDFEREYPKLAGRTVLSPIAASLGLEPDPPEMVARLQVYYVGHLYEGRGIDLVLRVAALAPDMDFHFVGGEEADVARWRSEARSANLVFHGYVTPAALVDHYSRADVCLAPYQAVVAVAGGSGDNSRWMSPMKIYEYMGHGRAIVASDLPVIHEVLTPGRNAILCPPADEHAWLAALRRLAEDPAYRYRIARTGRDDLEASYTWKRRATRIIEHAEAVLAAERKA